VVTKKCSRCLEDKQVSDFGKLSSSRDGLQYHCRPCIKLKKAAFRKNNPESVKRSIKKWKQNNPEKARSGQNRGFTNYYRKNKDVHRGRVLDWLERNPGKRAFYNAWRRFVEAEQTIPLSEAQKNEMKLIYAEARRITKETGVTHHVDHIFPLAGGNCSGLHVPWNLQIIPATENVRKSNKVPHDRAACKFLGLSV
jgi:hypothetical protein